MIGLLILVQTCTTYCLYLFVACGGAQTDAGSDTKSPFWCVCVFLLLDPYKPQKKRILNYGLCILSWELLKQAELCCFCLWKNMWSVIANDFKKSILLAGCLKCLSFSSQIWGSIWLTLDGLKIPTTHITFEGKSEILQETWYMFQCFPYVVAWNVVDFLLNFPMKPIPPTSHQGATEDEVRGFGDSPFSSLELLWGPRKGSSEASKR